MVAIASFGWAAFGRPEFGDWAARWLDLVQVVKTDRLAYSFAIDLATFWVFQGWLVSDDMASRHCSNTVFVWIARLLPFLGLVIYLSVRPPVEQRLLGGNPSENAFSE